MRFTWRGLHVLVLLRALPKSSSQDGPVVRLEGASSGRWWRWRRRRGHSPQQDVETHRRRQRTRDTSAKSELSSTLVASPESLDAPAEEVEAPDGCEEERDDPRLDQECGRRYRGVVGRANYLSLDRIDLQLGTGSTSNSR